MATHTTSIGRKPKAGLRSQTAALSKDDGAWASAESTEMELEDELPPVRPKSTSPQVTKPVSSPEAKTSSTGGGMYAIMRDFLDSQAEREQRYLIELQSFKECFFKQSGQLRGRVMQSPRLGLPTPIAQRRPSFQRDQDSPTDLRYGSQPIMRTEPKLPVFQQREDIENFLHRFEQLAKTWRWPEEEWSFRLVPLLTGQALEAYLAMEEDQAEVYEDLREALLAKFNILPETYRQRFRAMSTSAGESPTGTYHRLQTLYRRWVKPDSHSKEEIGETIVLEQLLRVLPHEVRMWVKEHEPTTGLETAKLAQQYKLMLT
ncbi:uncharacterized protein [Danio rerio]|uniref:Uncharacterized protein n=1 Tax=Danio rerio TaxID=7955 RepID=A0AC58H768_DANRE